MSRRFSHYGDYRIPSLTAGDLVWLQLGLVISLFIRSLDYSSVGVDPSAVLDGVFPMWLWSVWTLTCGALLVVGLARANHRLIAWGHALSAVFFAAITAIYLLWTITMWPPLPQVVVLSISSPVWYTIVGLLIAAVVLATTVSHHHGSRAWRGPLWVMLACGAFMLLLHAAPADGIRAASSVAIQGWVHTVIFIRMGWEPIETEKVEPAEIIVEGE